MKKYVFVEYKNSYARIFEKEKESLKRLIPKAKFIEHIGSTSIPGLGGMGIIDILLIIPKMEIKSIKNKLLKSSYELMQNVSNKDRTSLKKTKGFLFKKKYHLHLTTPLSRTHKEIINFKKNLTNSEMLRQEYSELKKRAVKIANGDGKIYRRLKEDFIKKHSI